PRGRRRTSAGADRPGDRAFEVDRLEAERPVQQRRLVRLRRLACRVARHAAEPDRSELQPADPGAVLARAPERANAVEVAVRVADRRAELVDYFIHAARSPQGPRQRALRYR